MTSDNTGNDEGISKLIELLKKDMEEDLVEIDINKDDEDSISITSVHHWYTNSEKLIRVIANTLGEPLHQSINQLRYAGHHLLSYLSTDSPENKKADLLEAFKHCKRSTYDAFDAYIYWLHQRYSGLTPYLNSEASKEIECEILNLIEQNHLQRQNSKSRIEYYNGVNAQVIAGLNIIQKMNIEIRKEGVTKELVAKKEQLAIEAQKAKASYKQAREDINNLRATNADMLSQLNQKSAFKGNILTWFGIFATTAIMAASAISNIFVQKEHSIELEPTIIELRDIKP